jgi:hypothetical protein
MDSREPNKNSQLSMLADIDKQVASIALSLEALAMVAQHEHLEVFTSLPIGHPLHKMARHS